MPHCAVLCSGLANQLLNLSSVLISSTSEWENANQMNEILESQSDSCHNKKLIKKIISLFHSISLALSAVPSPCVGKKKKKIYMIFFFFFFCSFNECTQHHTFSVHTIELVIQIRLAHGKIGTKLLWGLSTAYGNIQRFRSCLPKGVRGKLHGYLIWL